jgi:hypothetical protein
MEFLILAVICRTVGTPNWAVWLAGICAALKFAAVLYNTWTDLN